MSERPLISDFDTLRQVTQSFEAKLNKDTSIVETYQMLHGEVEELWTAIQNGDPREIGAEAADVILFTQSILNMLGLDMGQVLSAKVHRNHVKYSPFVVEELISQGYSLTEARQILKNQWDRTQDKKFK